MRWRRDSAFSGGAYWSSNGEWYVLGGGREWFVFKGLEVPARPGPRRDYLRHVWANRYTQSVRDESFATLRNAIAACESMT